MPIQKIVDQPINSRIDELAQSFESEYRIDPFNTDNLSRIFGDAITSEAYLDLLLKDVSEESVRETISNQIKQSMKHRAMGAASALLRSEEGFDHTSAPGSNVGALDAYIPATILGYNAKSIMLDVYKALNHKDREFPIQFELAFAIDSNSTNLADRKFLPRSIRDGSIAGLLAPEAINLTPGAGVLANTHLFTLGGKAYAKLGVKGNAITESGKDIRDWAIAEDIRVEQIVYDKSAAIDALPAAYVVAVVAARAEVKGYGGDLVSIRHIGVEVNLTLADTTVVNDFFTVYVNRDTGEYRVTASSTGRIKGCLISAPFLNPTNAASSVRHGREVITARIVASPRKTMSVGLAMDTVMDEFVSANAGASDIVKYVSNEFSTILSGVNDNDMENHMISNIDKCLVNKELLKKFIASPKLGGFVAEETIDLSLRGPGGDRPLSWIEEGIKDTLSNILILSETDTEFSEVSDKEWVFIGYQRDVKRFVNTSYSNDNADASGVRFGFKKLSTYAYSDNFGQRVKFIGSSDKRYQSRATYGFLRSNSPKVQPTGVYHGYDFRIVKSRDVRQAGIDSISFWCHDAWDIFALCAVKITLVNPTNLYKEIVHQFPVHA